MVSKITLLRFLVDPKILGVEEEHPKIPYLKMADGKFTDATR